jgi:hypothetical protein
MDWIAQKAAETLAKIGRITIVVHDNGSLHTSLLSRKQWERWQQQGLYIFFLPPLLFGNESNWNRVVSTEKS